MYLRGGLSGHTSPPAMEKEVQSNHRISAWFALKWTFKVIQCHPLQWQGHLPPEQVVPSPVQLIPKSAKFFFYSLFFLFSVFYHNPPLIKHRPQAQADTTAPPTLKNSEKLSKSSMAGWLGLFLKNLRLLCPRTQPQGQGFGPCSFLWSLGILPNPHFRVRSRVYTLCAFNYTAIISWSYLYFLVLLLKSKPSLSH